MRTKLHIQTALMIASLLFTAAAAAQPIGKTLVKSFNLETLQTVFFSVDAPVQASEWDKTYMRVQISIELESGSDALLKSLVSAGRYNLTPTVEEGRYIVTAPNLGREVKIGGKLLTEKLSFTIDMPRGTSIEGPGLEVAAEGSSL